ncbi:MAG TPA: sugar porter family MFS transporter [Candidatus Limnocylindrales bacterium]|nr:sugar porter family MFS transporter [Candidatus Limnocylindrales bacterium]
MDENVSVSVSAPTSTITKTGARSLIALASAVAALGGLLFGYDTSVISGAMLFLRKDFQLSDVQLEFAVGIALAGALVGSALAGYSADRWGRRVTLLVTGFGFGVFAAASGLASELVTFVIARFFVGVCIGVSSLVTPLYLAEVSPASIRGALVSLNQLAITIGISAAYFVDYELAASQNWRWMFISAVLPAVVLVVGMVFLPESPRWLAQAGQRERALEGFRRLGRGAEGEAELRDVEQVLAREQHGFWMLLQPGFRMAVLVGIGLAVFQQITGINTIIYYSPEILRLSGYPSAKAAILSAAIIGAVNVMITIVSIILVDRAGRRVLLLVGTAGMGVALTLMGFLFHSHAAGSAVFYAMLGYIIFFSVGLGPVVWLLISEIYPTKVRGKAMSLATLMVWAANWVVAGTFLSLIHAAGTAGAFWIFAVICGLAFLFCLTVVPETKQRSLEDIERYWARFSKQRVL